MASKEVLLIHCPAASVSLPPMGIAYIAAYLEARSIACDVLDLNVLLYAQSKNDHKQLWEAVNFCHWDQQDSFSATKTIFKDHIEYWSAHVVGQGYRTVGFSLTGSNLLFSIALSRAIKALDSSICIIYGGPVCHFQHYASDKPFRFLSSAVSGELLVDKEVVDFIVLGEGEQAVLEIVQARRSGVPLVNPGVVTLPLEKGGQKPLFIGSLDDLSFPAWEKLPLDKYTVREELPILFSRGCLNRCSFCNDWLIWGGKYRYRSAGNIFQEMKTSAHRFRRRSFRCNDLMFNGDLKMLDELAGLLIDAGLGINWGAQGFIRTDMDDQFLQRMRAAGLVDIVYGVESLSDNVLRKMRKPFSFEDVSLVLQRTKAAGIRAHINLIVGFPGETEQDFSLTKRRLEEIRPVLDSVANVNCCRLMADAAIETSSEKFGIVFAPGADMFNVWKTVDGLNDLPVRLSRREEIENLALRLGLRK